MKLKFEIEVELADDETMSFELFDRPCFICPDHQINNDEIKECFLDTLSFIIEQYGLGKPENMLGFALKLRQKVLDSITIIDGDR